MAWIQSIKNKLRYEIILEILLPIGHQWVPHTKSQWCGAMGFITIIIIIIIIIISSSSISIISIISIILSLVYVLVVVVVLALLLLLVLLSLLFSRVVSDLGTVMLMWRHKCCICCRSLLDPDSRAKVAYTVDRKCQNDVYVKWEYWSAMQKIKHYLRHEYKVAKIKSYHVMRH